MNELLNILKLKRPYGKKSDNLCIKNHIDIIPGMTHDSFGNRIITVGTKPNILFSCHTDTVHKTDGVQKIVVDETKRFIYTEDGECLGADDGAGMWLMIQLINNKIPGMYIFHRGEEIGGLGSSHIAHETPEILKDITIAIAFDRRGTEDIITSQIGGKCASTEFCKSLAKELGMNHSSARGSFTDTANYTKLVEECTNISIGYYDEHRKEESLDYEYLMILSKKMINLDYSKLVVARKKGDSGYAPPIYSNAPYYNNNFATDCWGEDKDTASHEDIISFVMNNPLSAADLLFENELTEKAMRDSMYGVSAF